MAAPEFDHTVRAAFADGTEIDTFDEFAITHDMLSAGTAWTLALWYSKTRNSTWEILQSKAQLGALVTITIDDAVQLVGVIEDRNEEESRGSGEVMVISGRDVAGIAVDWDADPRIQLRNTTLEDALNAIFQPTSLGIIISDAAAVREVQGIAHRRRTSRRARRQNHIDAFRIKPGETMWGCADRICRQLGYMLWMAPQTDISAVEIVVDKPLEDGDPTFRFDRIVNDDGTFSGNIQSGSRRATIRGIPTEVIGFCHAPLTDGQDSRITVIETNDDLLNSHLSDGLVVDDPLPQFKFLAKEQAHTQDEIRREGRRIIARAMARFVQYECEVKGLSQTVSGAQQIYTINTLAHVRDDRRRIDQDMLITSVTLKRGRKSGTTTTVRMSPKGAIRVIPDDSAPDSGGTVSSGSSGGGGGGGFDIGGSHL